MKPLPWSFSSLNKFVTCPMQYYETKVLGNFKDEPGEVAQWGTYVHKCIEDTVNMVESIEEVAVKRAWFEASFPENAKIYMPQVLTAIGEMESMGCAECEMALSSSFAPCEWQDGWVRGIIDLLKVSGSEAWCVDWKLGKVKPDSKQLKLFALMVFYHYPTVNTVHTSFEWLQFKQQTKETYTRDQIPELWAVFEKDLQQYVQAFKTDIWQCRPSGLCRGWCPVESCQHWRPKK